MFRANDKQRLVVSRLVLLCALFFAPARFVAAQGILGAPVETLPPAASTPASPTGASPAPSDAADSQHKEPTAGSGHAGGGLPASAAQDVGNRQRGKLPLIDGYYDFDKGGIHWGIQDDEFTFGVRAMVDLDARIYAGQKQEFTNSGVFNPRTRFYFEGNLTKPIQYEFSFQETYTTPNLLDSYVNYHMCDEVQFRIGRFKDPFTYEWYGVHIWDFLSPERSLFATNFEGQRRFGLMFWGSLFENRLEYAVGSFDGQRNSFTEFNSSQDVMAFLDFRPFAPETDFFLRNLHIGGSVDAGSENNPLTPAVLFTSQPPGAATLGEGGASVPFLAFNPSVREQGAKALWELHLAYYYGGLSLLGAWDSGYQSYALPLARPVHVPISGYFIQAGYLLTGETINDRTLIDPLRPFDLRHGHFGLGAVEVTARYSQLDLGGQVFSGGLADPKLWTNHAKLVDVGCNWYLNKFVKVYFDWEHAMFGSPVFSNTGHSQKSNDVFWIRTQLYF
jgi:phosphate-selective porin OprO/OprP